MASQLFSNDARLKESIEANKKTADDALANHNKSAQSHVNGIAGNAATASKLKTARNINVTGDCLTGTAASFDGTNNVDIKVALNTVLKALGGLSPAANKMPYFTGTNAASLASLSEFMRGVMGKATAAEVRTAIGAISEPGVGVIAGDVSNADAWWVKLSGTIPLIIQGGNSIIAAGTVDFPIAFNTVLGLNINQVPNQLYNHLDYYFSLPYALANTQFKYGSYYFGDRLKWLAMGI